MNFNSIAKQIASFITKEDELLRPLNVPTFIKTWYDNIKSERMDIITGDYKMKNVTIGFDTHISLIANLSDTELQHEEAGVPPAVTIDKILYDSKLYNVVVMTRSIFHSDITTEELLKLYFRPICIFIATEYLNKVGDFKLDKTYTSYSTVNSTVIPDLNVKMGLLLEINLALKLFEYNELKDIYDEDILSILRNQLDNSPMAIMLLLSELK